MSDNDICRNVRDVLALAGRVPEDAAIREHVAQCGDCSRFVRNLQALERDLKGLGARNAPEETVERLLARPELRRIPPVSWRRWAAGLAVAASLVVAVISQRMVSREERLGPAAEIAASPAPEQSNEAKQEAGTEAKSSADDARDASNLEALGYISGSPSSQLEDEKEQASGTAVQALEARQQIGESPLIVAPGKKDSDAAAAPEAEAQLSRSMTTTESDYGSLDKLAQAKTIEEGKVGEERQNEVEPGQLRQEERGRVDAPRRKAPEKPAAPRTAPEPQYPEKAKAARVEGTVVVEVLVDRAGNVIHASILRSIPLLDDAALEAVRQWKYEPSDSEEVRRWRVPVEFRLPEAPKPQDSGAARSFLEDRERVDGLSFRDPRGYWANTYVPGDARLRRLAARLATEAPDFPHREARPAALPLDPSSTSALSLTLHADRAGITGKSRLLVQVGIRAADRESRRRPPMNVAVVLDLPVNGAADLARNAGAILEALESSREPGDRFRLIATGAAGGEVLSPETFRRGALLVALRDLDERDPAAPSMGFGDALSLAYDKVVAEDDPMLPLGTSLVLVVTGEPVGASLRDATELASHGAIGGVTLSAIDLGGADASETQQLALAGHGRAYALDDAAEAASMVDRELAAGGRSVARAVRLRIQLAAGVQLVDVLGSAPLGEREAERTRAEERAIDVRLARNLGIEADRGKDEDGIQIVIPAFYAGDTHSILLDVVASGPGPIAEVEARYKDLVQLQNTVAHASLALPRSDSAAGPLETAVLKDFLDYRVSKALEEASVLIGRGDLREGGLRLERMRSLLCGFPSVVPALDGDRDLQRSTALLGRYQALLGQPPSPHTIRNLHDSLLYASSLMRLWQPIS